MLDTRLSTLDVDRAELKIGEQRMGFGMEKIGHITDKIRKTLNQPEVSCQIDKTASLESQALLFSERLAQIIRPRSQSDRTTFRRVANGLLRGIKDKKYTSEVWGIVLGFATEAAGPDSRNPAAVFMKILKEQLGYGKENA